MDLVQQIQSLIKNNSAVSASSVAINGEFCFVNLVISVNSETKPAAFKPVAKPSSVDSSTVVIGKDFSGTAHVLFATRSSKQLEEYLDAEIFQFKPSIDRISSGWLFGKSLLTKVEEKLKSLGVSFEVVGYEDYRKKMAPGPAPELLQTVNLTAEKEEAKVANKKTPMETPKASAAAKKPTAETEAKPASIERPKNLGKIAKRNGVIYEVDSGFILEVQNNKYIISGMFNSDKTEKIAIPKKALATIKERELPFDAKTVETDEPDEDVVNDD